MPDIKHLLILPTLLTVFSASAECLLVNNEADVSSLSELKLLAHRVMDAEGNSCVQIEDSVARSACQCSYRQQPLAQFRARYDELLRRKPQYHDQTVCYSENQQGVSINFVGYRLIRSWCQ